MTSLVKSAAAILATVGDEPDHAADLNLLNPHDELLYPGPAAELLGITTRRLNQLANAGGLRYLQFFAGCKRRYLRSDVLALHAQRTAQSGRRHTS